MPAAETLSMEMPSGGAFNSSWKLLVNGAGGSALSPGGAAGGDFHEAGPMSCKVTLSWGRSRRETSSSLRRNQMPVGEGLHHVFRRDSRTDDLLFLNQRASFQGEVEGLRRWPGPEP